MLKSKLLHPEIVNGAEKGTSVAEQKVASRLLKMDS